MRLLEQNDENHKAAGRMQGMGNPLVHISSIEDEEMDRKMTSSRKRILHLKVSLFRTRHP